MLFECHPLGSLDPERLKGIIKIAEEDFKILRHEGESDEAYAERALRITRFSAEIPKLFSDDTWDTGSVVDSVTLGLASIVAANYKGQEARTIDPVVLSLLADRIREYRVVDGQEPKPDWTDEAVRELIKKFQLVDRPIGGEDHEKLAYARRTLKALRMVESALAASDVTDFDAIEALCMELAVILGKSPLPISVIKSLIDRIPKNAQLLKDKNSDDEEDEDEETV